MDYSLGGFLTAAAAFLAGGAGKTLLDFFRERNAASLAAQSQGDKDRLAANDQAFSVYKNLVDTLTSQVAKLNDDIRRVEQLHIDCEKSGAKRESEIRVLESKVEMMTTTFQPLVVSVTESQKTILEGIRQLMTHQGISS